MNKKYLLIALAVGVAVSASTSLAATKLLSSADNVIAVGGKMKNNSSYPANEAPGCLTDQDPSTKYLNRGQAHTGFIVTPVYGATVIKSMQFNTANDAPERDPATYELYGTNDEIKSTDNSFGDQEEWTLISSGTLNLPAERLKASEFYSFENEVSYTSYRMIFPTLKGTSALMQIADVQFYEMAEPDFEAGDWGILSIADYDSTIAIQPPVGTDSAYNTSDWNGSPPANAIDLNYVNRYANFAKTNVGLAIWPATGLTKLESFNIYTFTNRASCDPMTYQLFGTLDFRQSADNSLGTNETWVLLGEGSLQTPEARSTWSPEVSVETDEYYRGYKLLFTSIRDAAASDAEVVHISEMQFYGLKEDLGIGEPLLIPGDIARPINATKDINYWTTNSSSKYPNNENPPLVIDGSVTTKYLNSGGEYTGFIVTPAEAAAVKSFKMWTANDATERDPDVYQIWGRNTDYTETDNGLSTAEGWTLIAEGAIALPTERNTEGPLVVVENSASYKHYRVIFPSLRTNGNSLMQLAEMQLYSDAEGTVGILAPGNPIIAVQASKPASHSGTGESPQHTIDVNTATKYYNGAGTDSGVIFLPMNSSTVVKAIELTTANDSSERDPASFILYGTNEEVVSPDFSRGNDETWEEIASGDLDLPESRKTKMLEPFVFENDKAYSAYKIIFPTIRGKDGEQEGIGLQFSEIQFYGDILEAAPVNLVSNLRGDFFIAVRSAFSPSSRYNNNPLESPAMALDGNVTTKYLNSGNYTNNLGMIVTPAAGKKAIQHMEFSTGNDFEGRDPSSYKLYGTDDPITSEDNSDGSAENWTLVAEGTLEFPSERQKTGYWVDLPAATPAFTSWKIVFPTIKGVDSAGEHPQTAMQFADIQFISPEYEYFLSAEDFSIAVGDYMSGSGYPAQEGPFAVADENIKVKYLNFGMERSGFIVTPTVPITPNALMFTTANDAVQRDPTSVEVYGTDDPITSLDNSAGIDEDWTLIAEGALVSDNFRYRNSGIVRFDNEVTYTSYKVLFPTVKNPATAGCMQLGEFYFFNLSDTPEPPITPPILNFAVVDGKLVLRWAVSSRAVLEVSTQAMGGTWTHAGVPQLDEGTYYYEVPMTEKTAYYRLVVSTDAQ